MSLGGVFFDPKGTRPVCGQFRGSKAAGGLDAGRNKGPAIALRWQGGVGVGFGMKSVESMGGAGYLGGGIPARCCQIVYRLFEIRRTEGKQETDGG